MRILLLSVLLLALLGTALHAQEASPDPTFETEVAPSVLVATQLVVTIQVSPSDLVAYRRLFRKRIIVTPAINPPSPESPRGYATSNAVMSYPAVYGHRHATVAEVVEVLAALCRSQITEAGTAARRKRLRQAWRANPAAVQAILDAHAPEGK